MLLSLCYALGAVLTRLLPRRLCYRVACWVADGYGQRARRDREAIRANLAAILGTDEAPEEQVREVFRNFAMYLVDFFRFGRLTPRWIRRHVRMEGLEHMNQSLQEGRGVVGAAAHLGNYELAGAVLTFLGFPVHAVVLTHRNRRVDRFFIRQRSRVGVRSIPIQAMSRKAFLEAARAALSGKNVLGLVADRDYFNRGLDVAMFGKTMRLPTGPAWFSLHAGVPVVPCFLIREPAGDFRLILKEPLRAREDLSREEAVRELTTRWAEVLSGMVRRYPTQWYMFQEFWKPGAPLIL